MRINHKTPVEHSIECKGTPQLFLVTARTPGWRRLGTFISHEFILVADSADNAVAALKDNTAKAIEAIKATMRPKDFLKRNLYQEPSIQECKEATRLEEEISVAQDKLNELEDATGELAEAHRATLQDTITSYRKDIKELRTPKLTNECLSRFEQITAQLRETLEMQIEASPLSHKRAYPVSYFDDERSLVRYVPEN